jgi:hypothetical protein
MAHPEKLPGDKDQACADARAFLRDARGCDGAGPVTGESSC